MRYRSGGHLWVTIVIASLLGLSACGINAPAINPTVIVAIPTNTLAPIMTQTQRFTATPIPTTTLIPTITLSPTNTFPAPTETYTPNPTATPPLRGTIKTDAGIVNMRTGPGTSFKIAGNLRGGSSVTVFAASDDNKWFLVRLDDGSEGWLSISFIVLNDAAATIPALTTPQLTERAQLSTAISLTQTAMGPSTPSGVPIDASATHAAKINKDTDVLAYCDKPNTSSARNRRFSTGAKVVIFWSWEAKTPEQIKDHLNNAQYEVKINGQIIGDWAQYASKVVQGDTGLYVVYWFVPLGQLVPGTYKIDYKLTWKAAIYDGLDHYGPGTDKPTENFTCSFTVK